MNGALHLERKIQNRLNEMDLNLFLDKDKGPFGIYYSVKHAYKIGEEPSTVLEWTDTLGRPRPLSEDLIIQVRSQEGSLKDAIESARLNNIMVKEAARLKRHAETEERAKEFEKSAKILHVSGPWAPKHDVTGWSNKNKG